MKNKSWDGSNGLNDICIGEKKIAGILIENALLKDRIKHCVTGIGLNINQCVFPAGLNNATSMCLVTGTEYLIDHVLEGLLEHLSYRIRQLYDLQFVPVRAYYMDHLQYLDEWRDYTDATGRFEGKIVDVSDSGELLVTRRTGRISAYAFKEITFFFLKSVFSIFSATMSRKILQGFPGHHFKQHVQPSLK